MMCLHEDARKGGCVCEQRPPGELCPLRMKGCDIRLSTAVSNSARFPVISPHGDIPSGSKVVDRIVDGGYFDYSGIVSALELRAQIMRMDEKLNPFVLFATNDPGFTPRFNPDACDENDQPRPEEPDELDLLRAPALPPDEPIEAKPFSILAYPLDALLNGRISRGEQTMANAVLLNRQDNLKQSSSEGVQSVRQMPELKLFSKLRSAGLQSYLNFDIVSVGTPCGASKQIRPVPMSWWLAMPTQAYLDGELCARHNRQTIAGLLSQLGAQPDENDKAAHQARYRDSWRRVLRACRGTSVGRTRQVR
jgi:hypothetical protein